MSLETQVADLVTATNALVSVYQTKADEIDAEVTAAVQAIPAMSKTFYVDAINGNDANDGEQATPKKTFKAACDAVPVGGYGVIYLTAAQTFELTSDIELRNKYILVNSRGYTAGDVNTYATLKNKETSTAGQATGIILKEATIYCEYVNITTAAFTAARGTYSSFIYRIGGSRAGFFWNYGRLTLSDGSLVIRASGGSEYAVNITSIEVIEALSFETTAIMVDASSSPIQFQANTMTLPTGKTIKDYITSVVRDASGYPLNVLSGNDLRIAP